MAVQRRAKVWRAYGLGMLRKAGASTVAVLVGILFNGV